MMPEPDSDEEIERLRQDRLASVLDEGETGAELAQRFAPGSFGCHEALHTASILLGMVDERLCEHPAIVTNPDWHRLAHRAFEHLFALYQAIGASHFAEPRDSGEDPGQ